MPIGSKRYLPTATTQISSNTYLADSVDVTVVGQDFDIAGQHQTPQVFHDAVWARMTAALKLETLRIEVVRVIGGVESACGRCRVVGYRHVQIR